MPGLIDSAGEHSRTAEFSSEGFVQFGDGRKLSCHARDAEGWDLRGDGEENKPVLRIFMEGRGGRG